MMIKSLAPGFIFYLIISAIELSAGVVANGFIVGLNCIDWAKSRTLTSYDKIITSLAFSRFCLQFSLSLDNFFFMLYPDLNDVIQRIEPNLVIWMFINQTSLCFASCLSVFYCVKIATFNLSLFSWLKLKISKLVQWLLLGSVLYCLVTTVSYYNLFIPYWVSSPNFTDRLSRNVTASEIKKNLAQYTFRIHSFVSIFPLFLFIASSVLLIISLWKHLRKMKLNSDPNPSFRNISMDVHVRALKSVVSFFILYNIYYVVSTWSIGNVTDFSDEWKMTVFTVVGAAYPSVHSIILILGNPKLKLASARILHSTSCCFREITS